MTESKGAAMCAPLLQRPPRIAGAGDPSESVRLEGLVVQVEVVQGRVCPGPVLAHDAQDQLPPPLPLRVPGRQGPGATRALHVTAPEQ